MCGDPQQCNEIFISGQTGACSCTPWWSGHQRDVSTQSASDVRSSNPSNRENSVSKGHWTVIKPSFSGPRHLAKQQQTGKMWRLCTTPSTNAATDPGRQWVNADHVANKGWWQWLCPAGVCELYLASQALDCPSHAAIDHMITPSLCPQLMQTVSWAVSHFCTVFGWYVNIIS